MGREEKTVHTGSVPCSICWVSQLSYLVTIAYFFVHPYSDDAYVNGLVATTAATHVCFVFGFLWGNTSVYDPYWHLSPIALALGWISTSPHPISLRGGLSLAALMLWFGRFQVQWPW